MAKSAANAPQIVHDAVVRTSLSVGSSRGSSTGQAYATRKAAARISSGTSLCFSHCSTMLSEDSALVTEREPLVSQRAHVDLQACHVRIVGPDLHDVAVLSGRLCCAVHGVP